MSNQAQGNEYVEVLFQLYHPMEHLGDRWINLLVVRFTDPDVVNFDSGDASPEMYDILYEANLILSPRRGQPGELYSSLASINSCWEPGVYIVEQYGGYDV